MFMLQKTPNSVNNDTESELSEYMDFEKMWEKKHKSDGSKDLPKFGTSDFKFITVLGKGSFGKVCVHMIVYIHSSLRGIGWMFIL